MSKRFIAAFLTLAAVLLSNRVSVADPVPPPDIMVTAGQDSYTDIPVFAVQRDPLVYGVGTSESPFWVTQASEYLITLSGEFVVDPVVTFGFSVTNFAPVPIVFGVMFTVPVALTPGLPTVASSSIGYSLTDGGTNGVTLTPVAAKSLISELNGTNLGVDVGDMAVGAAGTTTVFSFAAGPAVGPVALAANTLKLTLLFTLSPGDTAGITGRVEINSFVIPEPSSVVLSVVGLLGVGGLALRRRRVLAS